MIKNIGIIGVGGVGGFFGGKLCHLQQNATGLRISFLARGAHLRAIQESGLLLSSEDEGDFICAPALATDDFLALPPLDLCLICVKDFDLSEALSQVKPVIGDETVVLPLLNGVNVYSRVRKIITKAILLPACVYVGTHLERPGKIFQRGGGCKILFGPDPSRPDFAPAEVIQIFAAAKIEMEWTLNIQTEIWKKFIFICAYGLVSAAYNRTLGEILENDALRSEVQGVMAEIISLAEGLGVVLPEDIAKTALLKAQSFPYEAKTSFQRDFERIEKKDERDLFGRDMEEIARALSITIPKTRTIVSILERAKPRTQYLSDIISGLVPAP